jgi:hypothetical protein
MPDGSSGGNQRDFDGASEQITEFSEEIGTFLRTKAIPKM